MDQVNCKKFEGLHISDKTTEKARGDYPIRSFMDDPDIKWRHGKQPDFSKINKKFMAEKTRNHKAGSLEKMVEDLIKTWEMESTNKMEAKDWKSVDTEKYGFRVNMGPRHDVYSNIKIGNYGILMKDSPIYDVNKTRKTKDAFLDGIFCWEVLEVYSGPPKISFTWHHWGTWSGHLNDATPTGETINMYGMCMVEVDNQLRITDLQVFVDPHKMLGKMLGHSHKKCPFVNK